MLKAARKRNVPDRIILAGGFGTSQYVQKRLKAATRPEAIFADGKFAEFRNPKYLKWTVDSDPLFTVLKGVSWSGGGVVKLLLCDSVWLCVCCAVLWRVVVCVLERFRAKDILPLCFCQVTRCRPSRFRESARARSERARVSERECE